MSVFVKYELPGDGADELPVGDQVVNGDHLLLHQENNAAQHFYYVDHSLELVVADQPHQL